MTNIFITGGTGLLGWDIVKELLKKKDTRLYLLARGRKGKSGQDRINGLIKKSYKGTERKAVSRRIQVIEGDITEKRLGIAMSCMNKLCKEIDTIYHSAALCEFGIPWERIKKINVYGTKNVLDFAMKCKKNGQFKSLNYISTVGVAGKAKGIFYEDDLDVDQAFNNTYERSKFEAEKLVEKYRKKGLIVSVYRPSIITGDSKTGETSAFQTLYQPMHIFSLGIFDKIPANKLSEYNLVPVDYVAKAVCLLSSNGSNKNYHLTNPNIITLDFLLDTASSYFGFKKPKLILEKKFNFVKLAGFKKRLIASFLPYFNYTEKVFDTVNFDKAMEDKFFLWPVINKKLLIRLFKYCADAKYIQRNK